MKGTVRIIAGQWRGRKLRVLNKPGLRPTPDRVRETLFNWLALPLSRSYCLDLFAGSGALGLEAASRGAQQVLLVEKDRDVVHNLQHQLTQLTADNVKIIRADVVKFLDRTPSDAFNIIFLDPPFNSHLLTKTCTLLAQHGWLHPEAFVYLKTERRLGIPVLPNGWQIIRQQIVGQVISLLVSSKQVPCSRDQADYFKPDRS